MTTVAPLRLPATCTWCGQPGVVVWLNAGCGVVHASSTERWRYCGARRLSGLHEDEFAALLETSRWEAGP